MDSTKKRGRGRPSLPPRTKAGKALRDAREARGWTQAELATRAGCSTTALAGWESGRRARVDSAYALKLVQLLPELNYVDLVTRPEGPAPSPQSPEAKNRTRQKDGPRRRPSKRTVAKALEAFEGDEGPKKMRRELSRLMQDAAEWAEPSPRVVRSSLATDGRAPAAAHPFPPEANAILGLIGNGRFADAREQLQEELDQIYAWRIPLYRWILAQVCLAQGDSNAALSELQHTGGEFESRVLEWLARVRQEKEAPGS